MHVYHRRTHGHHDAGHLSGCPRWALVAVALVAPLSRAAYARMFAAVLRRNVKSLSGGDYRSILRLYAKNGEIVFPGRNSWAGTYRGRAEIERFLARFVRAGLQGEIGQLIVSGPPWDARVAVHFNDRAHDDHGAVIYENRAVIALHVRWGRVLREEVYEDTQRVGAFDAWLGEHRPAAAAAGR